MRHIWFVWILLFGGLFCKMSVAQSFRFKQIPSELGAPRNGIETILQDHKGFIWIGTWSGLVKFDGYSVKMYAQEPGYANGLRSNKISAIFEDSKHRLWIGTTYSGFYLYDRGKDIFIPHLADENNSNSLTSNSISSIIEDNDGLLWIGTEKGLNRFHPESGDFDHYFPEKNKSQTLGHEFIRSLAKSPSGEIWVGTELGLNRIVNRQGDERVTFMHYDLSPENVSEDDYFRHNFVGTMCPSVHEPNTIWIGTSIGLKKIQYSSQDYEELTYTTFKHDINDDLSLSHRFVSEIIEEDTSRIWVATYNGLNLMNTKTTTFQHFFPDKNNPQSLSNNVFKSLFKDRTGVLWIGTEKGINYVNLNDLAFENIRITTDEKINTNFITSVIPAQYPKGLWVGTHGGGIMHVSLDPNINQKDRVHFYSLNPLKVSGLAGFISEIEIDSEGWVWIATQGAGLLKIKENQIAKTNGLISQLQQFTKENPIIDDYIMSLEASQAGDIWMGYWDKGLERYDRKTDAFQYFSFTSDSLIDLRIFPIIQIVETVVDGKAFLWLARVGGGLLKLAFNPVTEELTLVKHYQYEGEDSGNLSNNFINTIYPKTNETLWIGTESGLNFLDTKTDSFTSIRRADGLASSDIQSVLERDETLWVSTPKGISSIQILSDSFNIHNYDMYDGLPGNLFYPNTGFMTPGGQMIFGGEHGLTLVKPENIFIDSLSPQVAITDFRLFNQSVPIGPLPNGRTLLEKSISETKQLELSYEDQIIAFEFVGLQFSKPEKIRYAFKLEGFDTDWIYTTAEQRIAHYTNLPYKSFVFYVKAANADGVWSEPVSLQVIVHPPFWQTIWAYLIYLLFVLGLLYVALRLTQMRAEFRHQLELEKLEKDKMEEVNKMKLQFFTNISHELKTPLTLIISPLEQYVKEQSLDKKLYRSITRMHYNANRLLTMINQLLDIRKSEAGLMKLKVAEGNLAKFVNEVMLSFKGLSKQKEITLQFFSTSPKIAVWFDRDQMEKVMFNLMTNAIKFTNPGGKILVKLSLTSMDNSEKDSYVQISVEDTGVGIPENQLSHIFDRFYQVEKNEESSRKGGTGIGLALSKSIVESHSGKIWAESIEDQGTMVFVALPLGESHFADNEKITGFQNSERISQYMMPAMTGEGRNSLHELFDKGFLNQEKPTVLIVEDNSDIRDYLRENLEEFFQVEEAEDGVSGWEKAEEKSPDLILADISMPRMDGIELCEKVKSNIATSHIPIILLTARTSLVFKIDGLETGADDYITKPFNMRLLATRIRNLIESRKNLQEKFTQNMGLNPDEVSMNSLDEELLAQIKVVLEKNLDNASFSVENLAESINMSRMQMYRKLKSLTGHTPNKIIRAYRLKKAAQLLTTGRYNVSEVTYMVGYNDLKSFREQFKKEFGVNPSGYEK